MGAARPDKRKDGSLSLEIHVTGRHGFERGYFTGGKGTVFFMQKNKREGRRRRLKGVPFLGRSLSGRR
jgi:hypothetical protein